MKAIQSESDVLKAARRIFKLNQSILYIKRTPTRSLYQFLEAECDINDLETERQHLLETILEYDDRHNQNRKGAWFVTACGNRFWRDDPRPEDIHIDDIAHALAMLCRYSGQVRSFFSVAQHSCLVSQVVHPKAALAGLLHDAAEAYLGDIISPVKKALTQFKAIEDRIMLAVCSSFGLDFNDEVLWAEVKRADNVLLSTEFRDLACSGIRMSEPTELPMDEPIRQCWSPRKSKTNFLRRFEELYGPRTTV